MASGASSDTEPTIMDFADEVAGATDGGKPQTQPTTLDDDRFSRLEKMVERMALVVFAGPKPIPQPPLE